jgi:KDO2-lipid IV(A) lauroyltransferase
MPKLKTKFTHRAEFMGAYLAIKFFRLIGPRNASNLGGGIAKVAGKCLPISKMANKNISAAMPELTAAERQHIVAETWENLGRTIAELAHIGKLRETISGPGYRISGAEHLENAIKFGGPNLVLTGHLGNWEIIPPALSRLGIDLAFMYRAANNPLVDALILKMRNNNTGRKITMFAKGSAGARGAYTYLKHNGNLGMLIDQKLDNGISVPFFDMPAMTAPALAALALKFRCAIIPIHVVREGPARLHIICEAPLLLPDTGNKEADILTLMITANKILERWIREVPGSWLWLHRRWPKPSAAPLIPIR